MPPRISLPSIAALLALLLAPLSGIAADRQAQVADLVRALGYGNAIHQFKNYVIRGADKHSTAAAERFNEAKASLAKLSGQNAAAVAQATAVIEAYEATLPKIQGMVAEGKTPTQIDQTVKIDDTPAIEGLAALRGQ